MTTAIEWIQHDEATGDEISHDLPAKWEICGTCQGEGRHSLALGAITEEDRDQYWSEDEWDDYRAGGYDSQCDTCKGSGKVLEVDVPALVCRDKALAAAYQAHLEDEYNYQQLCDMERRMGC